MVKSSIIAEESGPNAAATWLFESAVAIIKSIPGSMVWNKLSELCQQSGQEVKSHLVADKALLLDSLDKNKRFSVAYRYAAKDEYHHLAYSHYSKLLYQDRRYANCLNNYALLLGELDMSAEKVKLLKEAKEFEAPYPHGNLAIELAKTGFLDEGLAIIQELPEPERLESRAVDATEFIRRKRSTEETRMEALQKSSRSFHSIYRKAAEQQKLENM